MPRPQLTKTESLIYRGFIVAYLLLVTVVIGGVVWSLIGDLPPAVAECGTK